MACAHTSVHTQWSLIVLADVSIANVPRAATKREPSYDVKINLLIDYSIWIISLHIQGDVIQLSDGVHDTSRRGTAAQGNRACYNYNVLDTFWFKKKKSD